MSLSLSLDESCPRCGRQPDTYINCVRPHPQCPAKTMTENFKKAHDILREAADLFQERNAVYGDNFKMVGHVMKGFFPNGVTLVTEHDHNRFHIFMLMVVKLSRYTVNWEKGHQDSIRDNTVYSAMLEMIDGMKND